MIDDDECEAVDGMRIGRGNRNTLRKPASVPLCPPQIPHDLNLGSNPGGRGGKPATNRLNYSTASFLPYVFSILSFILSPADRDVGIHLYLLFLS
jgi:hypothetical protein